MQKYTRKCEFPRAEIHTERCITACGNTLNQVQKNSSFAAYIMCRHCKPCEFLEFVWTDCWGNQSYYVALPGHGEFG